MLDQAELLATADLKPPVGGKAFFLAGPLKRYRAAYWPAPVAEIARGTVLVLPGLLECIEKYFEIVVELRQRDFAVAALDWPAQGLSDDFAYGGPMSFDLHDEVLSSLGEELERRAAPQPWAGLGHSAGGCLLLSAARLHRQWFSGLILSAPMIEIAWHKRLPFLARLATLITAKFSTSIYRWPLLQPQRNTSDSRRHVRNQNLLSRHSRLHSRVPVFPWYAAAIERTSLIQAPNWCEKISTPALIMVASEDNLVVNSKTAALAKRKANWQVIEIEGSRHELLMEKDSIRSLFWQYADNFLDSYLP